MSSASTPSPDQALEERFRKLRELHPGGLMPEPPADAPKPPRPWSDPDDDGNEE